MSVKEDANLSEHRSRDRQSSEELRAEIYRCQKDRQSGAKVKFGAEFPNIASYVTVSVNGRVRHSGRSANLLNVAIYV